MSLSSYITSTRPYVYTGLNSGTQYRAYVRSICNPGVDESGVSTGTTFATLEEGASMVEVMNQVGYDLMVPGNHDFNYGQDRLLELEDMADFPLITANVQYAADDTDFMNPYVIQEFDGVRVGFFGITTPETLVANRSPLAVSTMI